MNKLFNHSCVYYYEILNYLRIIKTAEAKHNILSYNNLCNSMSTILHQ